LLKSRVSRSLSSGDFAWPVWGQLPAYRCRESRSLCWVMSGLSCLGYFQDSQLFKSLFAVLFFVSSFWTKEVIRRKNKTEKKTYIYIFLYSAVLRRSALLGGGDPADGSWLSLFGTGNRLPGAGFVRMLSCRLVFECYIAISQRFSSDTREWCVPMFFM